MISLTPNSTPADARALSELLALVSDPVAARDRLAELTAQAGELRMTLEQAEAQRKEVEQLAVKLKDGQKQLDSDREGFRLMAEARSRDMDEYKASLASRGEALDEWDEKHKAAMLKREQAVMEREQFVGKREVRIEAIAAEVEPLKNDLDRRLKLLREAAG